jgi:outer membrane protein
MKPVLHALAVAAFALHAAPALALDRLDLMGAYQQASVHDPAYAAAARAVEAGREKAVQGRSLLLPQLQLAASSNHLQGQSGSGALHEAALQLKQPLIAAQSRAEKAQLETQTSLAELRWRDAGQQLMQRVAEAYLQVLLADEHLRVVQAERAAVALQRERAQARFDLGRGRITELQEAQARLDAVATRELQADSTLALRRAQFEALTGAPSTALAPLRTDFQPRPPQPDDAAEWQRLAAANATRVLTKQKELAIAGFETRKYTLAARPTLDLVASAAAKGQSGVLPPALVQDGRRSSSIGLQLTIPLYTGGGLGSKERESIATQAQVEQELAAARRDARLQAHDAYLAVTTGVSRIGSLEQSVRSAQTALDATTLGRDLGTRTELDVLDAQQRLYTTRLDLAQARNDYLLGRVRLAAAAGTLDLPDLQSINTQLQP